MIDFLYRVLGTLAAKSCTGSLFPIISAFYTLSYAVEYIIIKRERNPSQKLWDVDKLGNQIHRPLPEEDLDDSSVDDFKTEHTSQQTECCVWKICISVTDISVCCSANDGKRVEKNSILYKLFTSFGKSN